MGEFFQNIEQPIISGNPNSNESYKPQIVSIDCKQAESDGKAGDLNECEKLQKSNNSDSPFFDFGGKPGTTFIQGPGNHIQGNGLNQSGNVSTNKLNTSSSNANQGNIHIGQGTTTGKILQNNSNGSINIGYLDN